MTITLRVEAPHFVAGSVWARFDGQYRCTESAPILAWMIGKSADEVGRFVKRKGWRYEWLRPGPR